MAVNLETLPDEILGEVFSYFENVFIVPLPLWSHPTLHNAAYPRPTKTLYNLALVSKRISRLSQPFLYRHLILKEQSDESAIQNRTPLALSASTVASQNHRFRYVRELEVSLYRLPAILLPATLDSVTRLTLQVYSNMGHYLSGLAACLQKLQFIKLTQRDIEGQPGDVQSFLSHLVSLDLERRPAGNHISQLCTLELESVNVFAVSTQLVNFAQYFGISALSLWTCYFEDFSLCILSEVKKITKLSLDSAQVYDEIDLGGLKEMAHLEVVRIGYMYESDPTIILKALPGQIRHLQIMYRDHHTLDALFPRLAEKCLPGLKVFEVQDSAELAALDPSSLSAHDTLDSDVKARYSANLSTCEVALGVLRDEAVRVIPPDMLGTLQACAVQHWGEGWRSQAEADNEGDDSQDLDADNGEDEEGGEM